MLLIPTKRQIILDSNIEAKTKHKVRITAENEEKRILRSRERKNEHSHIVISGNRKKKIDEFFFII